MSKVRLIISESKSPHFNLATEEYLLHHVDEDIVFIYDNTSSVIVGKHQNAFEECNQTFCEKYNIDVVRRLSGGGTVFHGPGNLNFCFIQNGEQADQLINFKKFLHPVNSFLNSIGVASEYSGRNDLLVDGFKISGNAEHIYSRKKRVIHHGTLLYDADLSTLNTAIKAKVNAIFKTHAVKSVRSTVANICDYLPDNWNYDVFKSSLAESLLSFYSGQNLPLSDSEITTINTLVKEKYSTWGWNFGYSPGFEVRLLIDDKQSLNLTVKKGIIIEASIGNDEGAQNIPQLKGKPYSINSLENLNLAIDFTHYF